jgi:hypothetical protein
MSNVARAFLERWIEENIQSGSERPEKGEGERLALQCLKEAEDQGIAEEDIDEAAQDLSDGEDLVAVMENAIEQAENADFEEYDEDGDDEDA